MMTAALGTLAFLVTLWLLVVVGAAVLEESGAKIAAALKGQSRPALRYATTTVRMRTRHAPLKVMRGSARWRDAA